MAGALRGDAQPEVTGGVDGLDHVLDGRGADDRGGSLVDREVPCLAGDVPLGVAGADEVAVQPDAERVEAGDRVEVGLEER